MRIVIIDDSEAFRRRVKRHLGEDPAFEIVGEASDGDAGLMAIERLRPDVVLLDLYMPTIDGFSVLRHVKQHFVSVRVIVLTSDASAPIRQRCLNLQADAIIDKGDTGLLVLPALRDLQ